jgi:hypothetical protein
MHPDTPSSAKGGSRRLGLAALGILFIVPAVSAQDSRIEVDSRVRVTRTTEGLSPQSQWMPIVGRVLAISSDSIIVEEDDVLFRRALTGADIDRLEVSVGTRRHAGKGFLVGALVTGGLGALLGYATGDSPAGSWFSMTAGEKARAVGVSFGVVGGILGLAIGALSVTELWEVTALPIGLEPEVAVSGNRMDVSRRFE